MLITKIEKLIKEYYKISSIEIQANMHLINPVGNKEILCGNIYDLYPNKKVSKIRKFPLSASSPYEVETFAYISMSINLRKLKDLQLVDYKKQHYLYFVINTLAKDVRNAFGIDSNIKESVHEGTISCMINFSINKNYKIQVFIYNSEKIHNPYKEENIPPVKEVKIIVIKNKSFIPYL